MRYWIFFNDYVFGLTDILGPFLELIPEFRMGNLYERFGPVPVGFSGELGDSIFRDHVIGPVPA